MNILEFNNESLNVEDLPHFQDASYQKIAKEKLKVMYLTMVIFYSLAFAATYTINFIVEDSINIFKILGFFSLVVVFNFFYTFHAFHGIFYALREKDIIYKRGVFTKSTTIIPFNRVQNIAIHQGILSRWFGLADLELFTAGGNDVEIKGLYYKDALKMKEFITNTITDEVEFLEEDLKEKEINLEEN